MKKSFSFLVTATLISVFTYAQDVQPNQNVNYKISQAKYVKLADSLLKFEGTTVQNTYKAIDYMQDKKDRKEARKAFRQQLRLERARNPYYWGSYNNDCNNWNSLYNNSWRNFGSHMGYRSNNWGFWR